MTAWTDQQKTEALKQLAAAREAPCPIEELPYDNQDPGFLAAADRLRERLLREEEPRES